MQNFETIVVFRFFIKKIINNIVKNFNYYTHTEIYNSPDMVDILLTNESLAIRSFKKASPRHRYHPSSSLCR